MCYHDDLREFLEALYCCNCGERNLFGNLSCLAFDRNRDYYMAWCNDCEFKGRRILGKATDLYDV